MTNPKVALLDETARRVFAPVLTFHGVPDQRVVDNAHIAVACDVDCEIVRRALRVGVALLVGAEALRGCVDQLDGERRWLPMLPLRLAHDVAGARSALDTGMVGTVEDLAVTTYHGRPPRRRWEDDEVRPTTWFESAVWALDLIEYLTATPVRQTRWLRHPTAGLPVAEHRLGSDALAVVWHEACDRGPGPAYSATVVGERGTIMLRHPFAPGGLAVWRAEAREAFVPALPKPNGDGRPASTPGGWESHAQLRRIAELVEEPGLGAGERARAVRIVRHLADSVHERQDEPC